MKSVTWKKGIFFLGTFFVLSLAGCVPKTENMSWKETAETVGTSPLYTLSEADLNNEAEHPTEIVFEEGEDIYLIEEAGDYLLTGKETGQIRIDVQDEKVHLILDDAELRSLHGPAIYVKSAAKVVITVPEGSSSTVQDSAYYDSYADAKACIFSEDDLTFNGGGELHVYGYAKDAIKSKDILKILDTELLVQSKGRGICGNDGVIVSRAAVDIQCEGSGIYTKKQNKESKGFVDIRESAANIIAGKYGIDAAGDLYINEAQVSVFGVIQNIECYGTQYIQEGCLE